MKTRIGAFLLTLCMVCPLMSRTVSASGDGVFIWDEKGNLICDCEITEDASGDNWSYDAATQTLTLNNFHGGSIDVFCARIVLIGDNTLQSDADPKGTSTRLSWSTWFAKDYLGTMEGTGSLTIAGGMMFSSNSDPVLNNGLKITGGSARGDNLPLEIKDHQVVTSDETKASYVRIASSEGISPAISTTGSFTDVPLSEWYYEAVEYVHKPANNSVEYGLMDGTTAATFSPNTNADRATIVTALYRKSGDGVHMGEDSANESTWASLKKQLGFSDVSRDIFSAVWWATDNNIVNGYGNGEFGPNDPVTREQFAVFLYRYAQEKYSRTHNDEKYNLSARADLSSYTDSDKISSWAKDAMSWANAMGYITGVTDTTLNPLANVSRAEVATILMRAMVL